MTGFTLAALTAVSLTLIAAKAHAASYIKFDGLDGHVQGIEREMAACDIETPCFPGGTRHNQREWILIESMMRDADRGSDAGPDASAGRDATGG